MYAASDSAAAPIAALADAGSALVRLHHIMLLLRAVLRVCMRVLRLLLVARSLLLRSVMLVIPLLCLSMPLCLPARAVMLC